jgi:dTDP-4-amino-4,6-dideoxygalactose transaminase
MEIGAGDEVIVASNTYIATWLAVTMVGATPVPVEPDPATHNLDPALVAAAITPRTRVILPTHLYGQPADLDPILALAHKHGLRVLEDGAQAHGARYKGKRLGAHGDIVTWSFYPGKNLGALGDGGAITTDDPALAEQVRVLANYGSRVKYVNDLKGVNSRLDPLQAALLSVKLSYLDEWNARRTSVAAAYTAALAGTELALPFVPAWAEPAWHLFVVGAPDRSSLTASLEQVGVQTLVHYPIPPHLQLAYADMNLPRGSLPIAERLADQVLSLPISPHIGAAEVEQVITGIRTAQVAA